MTTRLIRVGVYFALLFLILNFFGQLYFNFFYYASSSNYSSLPLLVESVGFVIHGLPFILILMWALHNLNGLRWLGLDPLTLVIKVVLVVGVVTLIIMTITIFVQSSPYLPNIDFGTFMSMMDWLPSKVGEYALLGFAYRQLLAKKAGQKLKDIADTEVFS